MKYIKSIYESYIEDEGYQVVGTVHPMPGHTPTDMWRGWVYHIANNLAEMIYNKDKDKWEFKKYRYKDPSEIIAAYKDSRIWAKPENVDKVKQYLHAWMKEYPNYTYFDIN